MINDATRARTRRLVQFTVLLNKIPGPGKGRVKASQIKRLERFGQPIEAMLDDEVVGELAANRLAVLETMLKYCEANNKGNELKAFGHYKDAQRLHNIGDGLADIIRERSEVNGII